MADHLIDYHDTAWPEHVPDAAGGDGVAFAANVVRGGAAEAIRAVRDGGRLATITSDLPTEQRGIVVSSVYVRPDGAQVRTLSQQVAAGTLGIAVESTFHIDDAAAALVAAAQGHGGGALVVVQQG